MDSLFLYVVLFDLSGIGGTTLERALPNYGVLQVNDSVLLDFALASMVTTIHQRTPHSTLENCDVEKFFHDVLLHLVATHLILLSCVSWLSTCPTMVAPTHFIIHPHFYLLFYHSALIYGY